jgi:hypothetical protein
MWSSGLRALLRALLRFLALLRPVLRQVLRLRALLRALLRLQEQGSSGSTMFLVLIAAESSMGSLARHRRYGMVSNALVFLLI